MGRPEHSAREGQGYGFRFETTTGVASGGSFGWETFPAEGNHFRINSLYLAAPPVGSGGSGTHAFIVEDRKSIPVLEVEADSGNGLLFENLDWTIADRAWPAGVAGRILALDRAVGTPDAGVTVEYVNDTDQEQTGTVELELGSIRGARP